MCNNNNHRDHNLNRPIQNKRLDCKKKCICLFQLRIMYKLIKTESEVNTYLEVPEFIGVLTTSYNSKPISQIIFLKVFLS